ncbi:MAG: acetyl-CoA carboxylase, carboxyltransferase subunit beta [Bacillota bacterium]|nr:acetyl-CoA carboxylase, carboxyltransferase subunit beta [Bacillota bacterium]
MPTFKDLFRGKQKYVTVPPKEKVAPKRDIPDGLWSKCTQCNNLLFNKEIERNLLVCPKCNFHYRVPARRRIEQLTDEGTFVELDPDLSPVDPLSFPGYKEKLAAAQHSLGLKEAVLTGTAKLEGIPIVLAVMDFDFIGGSMGSVVGEKITRAVEEALQRRFPLIIVSTSGGARMQEGILSLMQMAKTAAALGRLAEERVLYISVLTNPCTAGVMASFASLGDIIIAEPGALVAFAGPRVIEQTIREKLPPGSHRAEFLLEHGFIDLIVERKELKKTLGRLLRLHGMGGQATNGL